MKDFPVHQLERLALLVALGAAVGAGLPGEARAFALPAAIGAVVLGVGLADYNPMRWQLWPAQATGLALFVLAIFDRDPSLWLTLAAVLLITASAVLSAGFSVAPLPAPTGPFKVARRTLRLTHPAGAELEGREVEIEIWRPAAEDVSEHRRAPLWTRIYRDPVAPPLMRALLSYCARVLTHAYDDAQPAPAAVKGCVLYHHGLVSVAVENPLLLTELASRGYIVLAISPAGHAEEFRELNADVPADAKAQSTALNKKLAGDLSREERARLSVELCAISPATNEIVRRRAADGALVLSRLGDLLGAAPGDLPVAAVGYSVGGAVAFELARTHPRIAAAVNLDGGGFSADPAAPLRTPALMLYSAKNLGGNDALKAAAQAPFEEDVLPDTTHLDLHDAARVLPITKWLGASGRADARAVTTWRNGAVADFLDRQLGADDAAPR
ncbi:MAG: hypothetical protein PVI23_03175 [Maricaulaceae bacterium]